jgi:Domain of unknown function (DUF1707)
MNTRVPGPTDYSSSRTASSGPRPGNGGMGSRSRGFPSGNLRVSDAERDAALGELSQHYQAGRLSTEELDERTSLILAARTGDELEVQLRDLPSLAAPAVAPPPQNRQPWMAAYAAPGIALTVVVLAAIAGVLALSSGHHGDHSWGAVVPVLIILLLVRRLFRHR